MGAELTGRLGDVRRFILPAVFVLGLAAVTMLRDRPQPSPATELYSFTGPSMGTAFTVKVVAPELSGGAQLRLTESIAAVLEEVDASMSTWREDSEISEFNRAGTTAFPASAGLLEVVAAALDVADRSDGAFDITVAPLVSGWGFAAEERGAVPSDQEIDDLKRSTGWRHLQLDPEAGTLRKTIAELQIDLSAIAKGYAVDQLVEAVAAHGIEQLMVEIGGEVRTVGRSLGDRPWRIGIEAPDQPVRLSHSVVHLEDQAMATSGDYRNYYEVDGRRVSHTIDPRTGRPVEHDLASVSVISASCMECDAWATALNVLGPEAGLALAELEGLAAKFLVRENGEFGERVSSAFASLPAPPQKRAR